MVERRKVSDADLVAESAKAAAHYVKTRCPHSDVIEASERAQDFARGFSAGIRFAETYMNAEAPEKLG